MSALTNFHPSELSESEMLYFQNFCEGNVALNKTTEHPCPFRIASDVGIDLAKIHKDSLLGPALWVAFLTLNSVWLQVVYPFKYKSVAHFKATYSPRFDHHSPEECARLCKTANWMNIFFNFVPAKKNKGMILQVVPKFCEGWEAKYITGSGQKASTQDRVYIYETEGNVKPFQRGALAEKRKRSNSIVTDGSSVGSNCSLSPVKRKRVSQTSKSVLTSEFFSKFSAENSSPNFLEELFSSDELTDTEDASRDSDSFTGSFDEEEDDFPCHGFSYRDHHGAFRYTTSKRSSNHEFSSFRKEFQSSPLLHRAFSVESNGDFTSCLELLRDISVPEFQRDSSTWVLADILRLGSMQDSSIDSDHEHFSFSDGTFVIDAPKMYREISWGTTPLGAALRE